jgi:hypothetical protein
MCICLGVKLATLCPEKHKRRELSYIKPRKIHFQLPSSLIMRVSTVVLVTVAMMLSVIGAIASPIAEASVESEWN